MKGINKQRFIEIYEEQSDAVFRYLLFRISDRETALDLSQETFMKFWDAVVSGKKIENDKAFLFTIARNLTIDWYRKKKSISLEAMMEDDDSSFLEEPAILHETDMTAEARFVLDKISSLPPDYRQLVFLRFVEDLRPKDISEILKLPVNTVSVRLTRAIAKLREITGYNY